MSNNSWDLPPNSPDLPGTWGQSQPNQFAAPNSTPAAARAPESKSKRGRIIVAIVAGLALLFGGGALAFVLGGGKTIAAMSYISTGDPGPNAFMPSVADADAEKSVADKGQLVSWTSKAVDGSDPNLYGGSGQLSVCDAQALVKNLNVNTDLKAAFAAGIGIRAEDVSSYVEALTPLMLMKDTWVTNHGFQDGKATPYQSVLQKGTAVLVDAKGVPRVRCACGNPLAEAWDGYTAPTESTAFWDGYDSKKVVAVYGSEDQSESLAITDVESGQKSKVEIPEQQRQAQHNAETSVTSDTPVTSPKDMGVKPDKELLDELGLPVAKSDEQRPTGGDRFESYVNSGGAGETKAESQFPDWRSQTTEVSIDKFYVDNFRGGLRYNILFEGHEGFCSFESAQMGGGVYSFECQTPALKVDLIDIEDWGNQPVGRKVNSILLESSPHQFLAKGTDDRLAKGYKSDNPGYLKAGESVQFEYFHCFNLADRVGCETEDSNFVAVDDSGVFFDGSTVPVGYVCGESRLEGSNTTFSVVVKNGAVDCDEAMNTVEQYMSAPNNSGAYGARNIQQFGDWSCSGVSARDYGITGQLGGCTQSGDRRSQVVFIPKKS